MPAAPAPQRRQSLLRLIDRWHQLSDAFDKAPMLNKGELLADRYDVECLIGETRARGDAELIAKAGALRRLIEQDQLLARRKARRAVEMSLGQPLGQRNRCFVAGQVRHVAYRVGAQRRDFVGAHAGRGERRQDPGCTVWICSPSSSMIWFLVTGDSPVRRIERRGKLVGARLRVLAVVIGPSGFRCAGSGARRLGSAAAARSARAAISALIAWCCGCLPGRAWLRPGRCG